MTAKEAVIAVLHEAGRPLRISDIMERIVAQKLWQTSGKTPEATLQAQLAVDINKKGAASQFIRTAPGMYDLRESSGTVGEEQHAGTGPESAFIHAQPAKSMMTFTEAAEQRRMCRPRSCSRCAEAWAHMNKGLSSPPVTSTPAR